MRRCLILVALACTVFAAGALAGVSVRWKPFATGNDSGAYGAYANASGSVQRPGGLAVRATSTGGRRIKVTYFYACNGDVSLRSGQVYVLNIANVPKCTVNAGGSVDGGSVSVVLLKAR